jgi:hypothetical protein
MLPGTTIVKKCKECEGYIEKKTISSGNTCAATFWTDGKIDAPMLPSQPLLAICPFCGVKLWIDEQEEVGSIDPWSNDTNDYNSKPYTVPLLKDYIEVLESYPLNREKEKYLRRRVWWASNDIRRETNKHPFTSDETKNLHSLLVLLDESSDEERLMKAEILRELGDFKKSIDMLSAPFPVEMFRTVNNIKYLANQKCDIVRVVNFQGQESRGEINKYDNGWAGMQICYYKHPQHAKIGLNCPSCNRSGEIAEVCSHCHGVGKFREGDEDCFEADEDSWVLHELSDVFKLCEYCEGEGVTYVACEDCDGKGTIPIGCDHCGQSTAGTSYHEDCFGYELVCSTCYERLKESTLEQHDVVKIAKPENSGNNRGKLCTSLLRGMSEDYTRSICRIILYCVYECPLPLGKNKTIDILRGSKSIFNIKRSMHSLETFGMLSGLSRVFTEEMVEKMVELELLISSEIGRFNMPILKLSKPGKSFLDGSISIDI